MTRLIFGANSSPSSALFVKDTNAKSFEVEKPEAASSIVKDSYVDDYLTSCKTIEEANKLISDVDFVNRQANFHMHSWASNERSALSVLAEKPSASEARGTQLCNQGERVLGLTWDTLKDELGFNVNLNRIPNDIHLKQRIPTKREVLRIIMSIYDPLGLIGHFTVKSQILMQQIWRSGVDWDVKIREDENEMWEKWLDDLPIAQTYKIPRCLTPKNQSFADVHAFCDASLTAFSAAVYVRFKNPNSHAHVSLVMAKAKVAPMKPLSVPRLELQAALLAARLITTVQKEIDLQVDQRVLWTDSQTVLQWIQSEPRTRQIFVAHRLGEISELTSIVEWRWVPTKKNPVDYATRWSIDDSDKLRAWTYGPDFLKFDEPEWPTRAPLSETEKLAIQAMEVRKGRIFTITFSRDTLPLTGRLVGWRGLLAVARRVRNLFDRWRKKSTGKDEKTSDGSDENYWIREIQAACFHGELRTLVERNSLKKGSRISSVCPFLDAQGLIRAEGRVTKLKNLEFTNNPIILDATHPATKLLLVEFHRRFYHASKETVVNEVRQKFYIVGLRSALKSITAKCIICKLRRAKPAAPLMAPLPAGRLAYRSRPFSHCGVDYFGPMMVKIGRRREKRWGVLFTCLTTRAIHLELAHSLNIASAIMAIQRLAARRGCPANMYSDNGTNFRGACKELREAIRKIGREDMNQFALKNGILWKFNPPGSPHTGGVWERLIRSVKTALHAILKEQAPNEEVLITILVEIEHSVNSRPLTHVSIDPKDDEALTPNHFLLGSSSGAIDLGRCEMQAVNLRKQWQLSQAFADQFWHRWLREYLPTLLSRKKWSEKSQGIKVGDFVLIVDAQAPRNYWKTGRVIEVYPGSDGTNRVAKIKTASGEYERSVHKLVKIYDPDEVQN